MTHFIRTALVVLLLVGTLSAGDVVGEKAKGPSFQSEGYTFAAGTLRTSSDVNMGDPSKSRYNIQFDGSVEPPANLDVVALRERFDVRTVSNAAGDTMLSLEGNRSYSSREKYNAVHNGVAQVELNRIDLTADASKIATMTVETEAIIAKKRAEAKLPAVVMEDYQDIGNGVWARISRLDMSRGRELKVTMETRRPGADTRSPFVEAVYALDPQGQELGGGRWTEGGTFATQQTWTAKFKLNGTQTHASFRLVLVIQSEQKHLTFEIQRSVLVGEEGASAPTRTTSLPRPTPRTDDPIAPPTVTPVAPPPPSEEVGTDTNLPEDPMAAYVDEQRRKRVITALRTAQYLEVEGGESLWYSPVTISPGPKQTLHAVGRIRYIGEAGELDDYEVTFQLQIKNQAGRIVAAQDFVVDGKVFKPDTDHAYSELVTITTNYEPSYTRNVKFLKKDEKTRRSGSPRR